jgi:hypothetical protein
MAPDSDDAALQALTGLLEEFRSGRLDSRKADQAAVERHLEELSSRWERRFPGFPRNGSPHASLRGLLRRGERDRYLRGIIIRCLEDQQQDSTQRVVVNPACVFGRHARYLASRLKSFRVVATDINPVFERSWRWLAGGRAHGNYEFRKEDVFNPGLEEQPTAVVFFGACGSVSDAAMDYAVHSGARYLMCRTCCHDNIGGNTRLERRLTPMNWGFRLKNLLYAWIRERATGEYFSAKYPQAAYPRSEAARSLCRPDELLRVSRSSVDSDASRAIIDLDRYLYLVEHGYRVWYRGELFVAERNDP